MTGNNFNLLEVLEQIREREKANLDAIDEIQARRTGTLDELRAIRMKSLEVLKSIDEIRNRVHREGGKK